MKHRNPFRCADGDFLTAENNDHTAALNFVPELIVPEYRGHFNALLKLSAPGSDFAAHLSVRNTGLADEWEAVPPADAGTVSVFWQEVSSANETYTSVTRGKHFTVPALIDFPLNQSGWLILRLLRSASGAFSFADNVLGMVSLDFDWILQSAIPAPDESHSYLVIAAVRVNSQSGAAEVFQQHYGIGVMPLPLTAGENSDSSSSTGSGGGGDNPPYIPPVNPDDSSSSSSSPDDPPVNPPVNPDDSSSSSSSSSSSYSTSAEGIWVQETDAISWTFVGERLSENKPNVNAEGIMESAGDVTWEDYPAIYEFQYPAETLSISAFSRLVYDITNNAWTYSNGLYQAITFPGNIDIDGGGITRIFLPEVLYFTSSEADHAVTFALVETSETEETE